MMAETQLRQCLDGKSILAKDCGHGKIIDNDMRGSRGPTGKVLSQSNSRNTQRMRKAMEMRKD